MISTATARAHYERDTVLSASPARLLTLLYDRLVLDLDRAEQAQVTGDFAEASKQLLHAQDIVSELSASLKPDMWDGGPGLLALYGYVSSTLVSANVSRNVSDTREAKRLVTPLRDAWHQAAAATSMAAAQHAREAAPMGGIRIA